MKVTLEELTNAVKDAETVEDLKVMTLDPSKRYVMFCNTLSQQMIESLSAAFFRLKVGVLVISNTEIFQGVKVFEMDRQE